MATFNGVNRTKRRTKGKRERIMNGMHGVNGREQQQ